ncbi:MAG: type II toxin-antitoxin system Phd/YefM family antitoxin [Ardenticatenaceae bacterium]
MMIVSSREGRARWRHLLDTADSGESDVVIKRNGKAVAALIPYKDFEALQEQLDELRDARRAMQIYDAWKQNPSRGRPYAEVRSELKAEGLLEDE